MITSNLTRQGVGSLFPCRRQRFARREDSIADTEKDSRPLRSGFSLLEVILALTILAGAVAVLGEVARQGMETARIARDLTYAQFICDSLMAEITSGIIYPESVDLAPVDEICDPSQMGWVYSIDLEATDIEGLVAVRVTVSQNLPEEKHPVRCSLVRWMEDPDMALSATGTQ